MEKCLENSSKKTKFILSLISAIIFQTGSSVILSSGNLGVYFLSYLHYKDTSINMQYGNIMSPLIILFLAAFSPLSGFMVKTFGPRKTFLISSLIVEISLIGFYFQSNLWFFYFLSLLSGIGTGLSAGVPLKNACRYYPKKKGFIGSIVLCVGGLANSLASYIGEYIINPEKKTIIDKKTEPYYPENVAERSKYFFIFEMCVIPVTTSICILLFYPYDQNCEILNLKEIKLNNDENNNNIIENKNKENNDNQKNTNTKEILFNFRFWRNMIIIGITPFWINFLTCTYRAYVTFLGVSAEVIPYIAPIITFLSSLLGPIWAICVDKFGYQIITKIIGIICMANAVYFIFFFYINNKIMYLIGLAVSCCASRTAMMSVINPHIMQIYEMKNFLIIGGFSRLFVQSSGFIAAIISIFISKTHKNADELHTPYVIMTIIGTILSIFGFVLTFFETDESFFKKCEEKIDEKVDDNDYKLSRDSENNNESN